MKWPQSPRFNERLKPLGKLYYALKKTVWRVRRTKAFTRLLGPRWKRSRTMIEIDITYLCNMRCQNCNRSVRQAPESLHLCLEQMTSCVDEWLEREHRWERIRVLGGEPTLHPQFLEIIAELERYRDSYPECAIEVVTNGRGSRVRKMLEALPEHIYVENSEKESNIQPSFGPFNLAPIDDDEFTSADYRNGCSIMEVCGMGLTPLGYYHCAVGGGIDRILGGELGRDSLPRNEEDMEAQIAELCRLCGRFRDGHFVPLNLRPRLEDELISPTWETLYRDWHAEQKAKAAEHSGCTAKESL